MSEKETKTLFNSITNISDEIIENAQTSVKGHKKNVSWGKWGAVAACLCLAVVGIFNLYQDPQETPHGTSAAAPSPAVGFVINNNENITYYPYTADDRERLGLTSLMKFTEDDLGEYMGTVTASANEDLIGCSVYRYAEYPNYTSVCIVDSGTYGLFTAEYIYLPDEVGYSSSEGIFAYGMPESVEKIEVLTADWRELHVIEEQEKIEQIVSLLANKENIGKEACERMYAQIWFEAYGNDDVYYSESDGYCKTRSDEAYKMAHSLWGENERTLRINTNEGYRFNIYYRPATLSILWSDTYYLLTDQEVFQMNQLLGISE